MAIQVTCPSCFKRFTVSDQFAGRTGPCPKCKKPIKVPEKSEQVVIHAPEEAGPKDAKGRSVLKPIRRTDFKLSVPIILAAGLSTIVVFGLALGFGISGDPPNFPILAVSSVVLAFPLVFVGYWFLQDDELEGFSGQQLLIRCGICSAVFAATWAVYGFIPGYVSNYSSMAETSGFDMLLFIPFMIAIGATVSIFAFELEVTQGILHYLFYFALTLGLAWLSGAKMGQPFGGSEEPVPAIQQSAPGSGTSDTSEPSTKPAEEEKPRINVLQ